MTNPILARWRQLSPRPGGAWLFSRMLGRMARYSGSIRPRIVELEPGRCTVRMADRAAVRNHLRSVHAIALMNLGEVASGLAVLAGLESERRGIVTNLSMRYEKKARGTITARAEFAPPERGHDGPFTCEAGLFDDDGDRVATITAEWTLGPATR
mgnify:FL=1